MVALQIRDVPENVRRELAERAAERGQSLQAFLLSLVTDEARRAGNLGLLRQFDFRSDGSAVTPDAAAAEIRAGRAERDPAGSPWPRG